MKVDMSVDIIKREISTPSEMSSTPLLLDSPWRDRLIINEKRLSKYLEAYTCMDCSGCRLILNCSLCVGGGCGRHRKCGCCLNCSRNIIPCIRKCGEKIVDKCRRFLSNRGVHLLDSKDEEVLYATHLEMVRIQFKLSLSKIIAYRGIIIFPENLRWGIMDDKRRLIGCLEVEEDYRSPSELISFVDQSLSHTPRFRQLADEYREAHGMIGYEINPISDQSKDGLIEISDIVMKSLFSQNDEEAFLSMFVNLF